MVWHDVVGMGLTIHVSVSVGRRVMSMVSYAVGW